MYVPHPSRALAELFAQALYQGVAPHEATFLFVGLDANYSKAIEYSPVFQKILEYHANGVDFWRKHKVHHPFLLPEYSGDGRRYHRSFARIGFTSTHAPLVSFVELLHRPTVGRSALVAEDLDSHHLEMLNFAILQGRATHIFIPQSVATLMRATHHFPWLPRSPIADAGPFLIWLRSGAKTVYANLHFSVYGKFEHQKMLQLAAIRELLP